MWTRCAQSRMSCDWQKRPPPPVMDMFSGPSEAAKANRRFALVAALGVAGVTYVMYGTSKDIGQENRLPIPLPRAPSLTLPARSWTCD
jgi:hypothetical protein